jgi:transcriptional regulator with XRE-family HTH domain
MTDKEFLKQLGLKLKCQRVMIELSVNDVAGKTGLHAATIHNIEKGAQDFHILNLRRLALVYGVEIKEML